MNRLLEQLLGGFHSRLRVVGIKFELLRLPAQELPKHSSQGIIPRIEVRNTTQSLALILWLTNGFLDIQYI